MTRPRVLFLCTGNSARSQMAEALLRDISGGKIDCFNAGTEPRPIHPLAMKTMAEAGLDIARQRSKPLDQFLEQRLSLFVLANKLAPAPTRAH